MSLRPLFSPALVLCLSDCAAVLVSCLTAFTLRLGLFSGSEVFALYAQILPALAIFPLFYLGLSLYPGTFLRRHEELKRLSIATSMGFMGLALFLFMAKGGHLYSRAGLLLSWMQTIAFAPLFRHAVRRYCCRFPWWAAPCILFGNGARIPGLYAALVKAKNQGLRPAVLVLDEAEPLPDIPAGFAPAGPLDIERVPLADPAKAGEALSAIAARYAQSYAVVSFDSSGIE
ncbi:MAG: hypothetical protein LBV01_03015, partial [Deltaproteobacteria bacterium]|nr:hypothetical protein [Deltaproteobacteria bacterium]